MTTRRREQEQIEESFSHHGKYGSDMPFQQNPLAYTQIIHYNINT